jgi:uncharacterized protein YdgA (DUF945 family)
MEFAGKGAVAAVSAKSKLAFVAPFIWDGDFHLAIQNGWLNEEKSGERFALAGVKIDSVIGFDKERKTLSATAEYSAESLTAGTEKIGNIFARFGVKGLNAERYETFMKLYTASMQSLFADIAAAGDDPEKMKDALERQMAGMGLQLFAAGEKLLTNGLELQLSGLHLQLPEGEIKMDLLVRLKKDTTFAQFIPMVNQPKLALDILELKTAISLPEKLVDDAPLLYAPIYPGMQTGLFVKSGDLAKHTAETRDGKLILNDKEVLWQ